MNAFKEASAFRDASIEKKSTASQGMALRPRLILPNNHARVDGCGFEVSA